MEDDMEEDSVLVRSTPIMMKKTSVKMITQKLEFNNLWSAEDIYLICWFNLNKKYKSNDRFKHHQTSLAVGMSTTANSAPSSHNWSFSTLLFSILVQRIFSQYPGIFWTKH